MWEEYVRGGVRQGRGYVRGGCHTLCEPSGCLIPKQHIN